MAQLIMRYASVAQLFMPMHLGLNCHATGELLRDPRLMWCRLQQQSSQGCSTNTAPDTTNMVGSLGVN